ncbi:CopD family protein [Pseudidiomarina homiensis]|uniref:CopD family protein n=1 Tax=Pseudidiomarina homiensis TaxID=364198 RepID=UPI00215B442A|nr:CopD family protein [Pseudidiomarina homiensis]
MTVWTGVGVVILTVIFVLNATLIASPYINYLADLARPKVDKKGLVLGVALLLMSVLYFFINVGNFAGEGLSGLFDTNYIRFMWAGPVGLFTQLQMAGVLAWLIYCAIQSSHLKTITFLVTLGALSISFLSMGHASTAAWWGKLALLAHLLVAWIWFGSLYPLRKLATSLPIAEAQSVMMKFGAHMSGSVPVLLLAGALLYRSASGHWLPSPPVSSYDIVFLTKLSLVILILLLAALHKLVFVPQLKTPAKAKRLQTSVTWEIVLAIAILAIAAALSSAFSPN